MSFWVGSLDMLKQFGQILGIFNHLGPRWGHPGPTWGLPGGKMVSRGIQKGPPESEKWCSRLGAVQLLLNNGFSSSLAARGSNLVKFALRSSPNGPRWVENGPNMGSRWPQVGPDMAKN